MIDVRVKKKPPNAQGRAKNLVTLPRLIQFEHPRDLRRASEEQVKQIITKKLPDGIELKPKYPLSKTEEIMAQPNLRGRTKAGGRQFGEAIYNGELAIPDEALRKHRKRRKQRGYRST